ncbi:MAG: hypothetical protein ACK4N5_01935 [Myxococcales bacterium]
MKLHPLFATLVAFALAVPASAAPKRGATTAPARTSPKQPAKAEPAPVQLPTLDLGEPEPPPEKPRVVEAVVPVEPPPPAIAAPAPEKEEDDRIGLMLGAKAALLVPAGRTTGVQANATQQAIDASRSATVAFAIAVGYALPFLDRALSIRGEAGFYPLSGEGSREYPNDPDFTRVDYRYSARGIPLTLGLGYRLPLPIPVEIAPVGGFAAVHTTTTSTWTRDGVSTEVAPQAGWALGFYLGAEAAYRLGPGSLTGEIRYVNARTDLGFRDVKEYGGAFNRELGDVQGTNVLLGYRFDL